MSEVFEVPYNTLPPELMASMHNHSWYSFLDSTMSPEFIVEQAKALGFRAVSVTEHGNMHSYINAYKHAKEIGIKYIFGVEAYETTDMDYKESDSDRYHLLLHAKNEVGLKNLFKVVTEASTRGFYGKPRVDLETISKYSEGLTATSSCLASRLMRLLVQGFCPCCKMGNEEHKDDCNDDTTFEPKWDEAKVELQKYIDVFGEDFYIEIQSHDTYDQMIGNQRILKLAKEMGVKHIITFDAHMKDGSEKTRDIHRKFVEISQQGREVGETYKDCYQQDMETIYEILVPQIGLEAVEEGIRNTGEWADKCEQVELDLTKDPLVPHAHIPDKFKTEIDYLKHLINKGWKKRAMNVLSNEMAQKYKDRLHEELEIIDYLGYTGYFLILEQITNAFKDVSIPLGYSRGSGGGCLILWMIGVTEIDSIRWDLDFSRFANKGRKGSLAD